MKRFTYVCAFALAVASGLQYVCLGGQPTTENCVDCVIQYLVAGVDEETIEYVEEIEGDFGSNVKLYKLDSDEGGLHTKDEDNDDFAKRKAATAYPTLYRPGNAEGVIVVVGYKGCGWCTQQLRTIPGGNDKLVTPGKFESTAYRVMYVNRDHHDPLNKSKDAPTWGDLLDKFELKKIYPTTLMIEKGKMTKSFTGFKLWPVIEPHVEAAKLEPKDTDDQGQPNKRRRFLDFIFPRGARPFDRSSQTFETKPHRFGGGVDATFFGSSPPRGRVEATPRRS
jgi:hypothetical protein